MARKKLGIDDHMAAADANLVKRLAAELKCSRESGQPLIYEQEFSTGRIRAAVVWDAWNHLPLEARTAVILQAYEAAEGREFRERIALASGLTVPEAVSAGMLPFQVIPGVRKTDAVSLEECGQAMLDDGATKLMGSNMIQLRFATEEEAAASVKRLVLRLPKSEDVWIITRDSAHPDTASLEESMEIPSM